MVVQSLHCLNAACDTNPSTATTTTTCIESAEIVTPNADDHSHLMMVSLKDDQSPLSERRRSSARIQKLKTDKAAGRDDKSEEEEDRVSVKKSRKVYQQRRKSNLASPPAVEVEKTTPDETRTQLLGLGSKSNNNNNNVVVVVVDDTAMLNLGSTQFSENGGTISMADKSLHAKVTETLRTFNKHYLHFVQEEEKRCGRVKGDRKTTKGSQSKVEEKKRGRVKGDSKTAAKGSQSKKRVAPEDDAKRGSKRPDLKALTKMMETNAILSPNKRFGSIPGIDVGHQFFSRAEMVAVGLHNHWLKGIDCIGQVGRNGEYSGYTLPLAVAIVLSGQYEDDLDNCEDVVYTGQGGNNLLGNRRQIKDQIMERGNLGLKNCMEQCVPVRVVRGHRSASSYVGKIYTYDGLYKVVNYWAEKGVSGFTVYKFRLKRLDGQPLLTTNQVEYIRGHIPNSISEVRGLVCEDITGGQEDIPIPATNLVDDLPIATADFTYCKFVQVAKSVKLPKNAPGCDCKDSCRDPKKCACARLNGSDFPYVHRDGGRLIEPKAIVFECGPNCGCGPGCVNRTSQRGLKYRLEVFRTPKKGWAVRSWDFIPSGAPVCEYTGVLMKTDDIDTAVENNYIFDIDCLQTMKGLDGRERRLGDVSIPISMDHGGEDHKSDSAPEFCIDAGSRGNIARFINHSCQPNLFVQCVLSSHHNIKLARVVLFAADNIPPLKELTYDYGYAIDSVTGPDGNIRQMACYCGAADCRKRLF